MQLGGIGREHNAAMHHVTQCVHNHSRNGEDIPGGMSSAANAATGLQQAELRQEAQFSLTAWMDRTFGKGKRMLQNFWGGSNGVNMGGAGEKSGNPQVMAQIYGDNSTDTLGREGTKEGNRQPEDSNIPSTSQIAAAATGMTNHQAAHENLPFATVEEFDKAQETIWQKMRVKFKDVAGQLAGHLPGKFLNFQTGSFFQAKQQQPKEEQRKPPKPGRDRVEIHCAQVEESYLLDSYDRNGGYSKLSTNK